MQSLTTPEAWRSSSQPEFSRKGARSSRTLELNVSSCCCSEAKAVGNLKEALRLFLDEARIMGTLAQILEEAGYSKGKQKLSPKEPEKAVVHHVRQAAAKGTLTNFLEDAGYFTGLIALDDAHLQAHIHDSDTIFLPMPRQLFITNNARHESRKVDERERHTQPSLFC